MTKQEYAREQATHAVTYHTRKEFWHDAAEVVPKGLLDGKHAPSECKLIAEVLARTGIVYACHIGHYHEILASTNSTDRTGPST